MEDFWYLRAFGFRIPYAPECHRKAMVPVLSSGLYGSSRALQIACNLPERAHFGLEELVST